MKSKNSKIKNKKWKKKSNVSRTRVFHPVFSLHACMHIRLFLSVVWHVLTQSWWVTSTHRVAQVSEERNILMFPWSSVCLMLFGVFWAARALHWRFNVPIQVPSRHVLWLLVRGARTAVVSLLMQTYGCGSGYGSQWYLLIGQSW